jgi:hypothetical protein
MVRKRSAGKRIEKDRKMAQEKAEEFVTVSTGEVKPETKIIFDTKGDSFTGIFLGMRQMDNPEGSYQQARFENNGEIYFVNANFNLRDGLKNVRAGSKVRVTYTNDLDTGQVKPMRCFKVEVARKQTVSHNS